MRRSYIRNSAQEAEQFRRRAALGFLCVGLALAGLARQWGLESPIERLVDALSTSATGGP